MHCMASKSVVFEVHKFLFAFLRAAYGLTRNGIANLLASPGPDRNISTTDFCFVKVCRDSADISGSEMGG